MTTPIYTKKTECQDCYKCLRECPVKAIRIKDGHAEILSDRCILCGHCLTICPVQAKEVRDDLPRVKRLVKDKRVFVSLAPSWISEFPEMTLENLTGRLLKLGFSGVSETAMGAEIVSREIVRRMAAAEGMMEISSACPVIVNLLNQYYPNFKELISPLLSPLLCHGRELHREFGEDIAVVFIGPCLAKKQEADLFPDYVDVSLSFLDIRKWFAEEEGEPFVDVDLCTPTAGHGTYYPVNGGMIRSLKSCCSRETSCEWFEYSGLDDMNEILGGLEFNESGKSSFVELLACRGGCVNGPLKAANPGLLSRKRIVTRFGEERVRIQDANIGISNNANDPENYYRYWPREVCPEENFKEQDIQRILFETGKVSLADQRNCGACGYNSCRDFACAVLAGRAETRMCVSYLKQLAGKTADALIRTMPSGLVLVDRNLQLVECNLPFARICGEDTETAFEAKPGLQGAFLQKLIPLDNLFADVLESGKEITIKTFRHGSRILEFTIFPIEQHRVVGGIFQDITLPTVRRDKIVRQASEVLEKNMVTVQKIAYLLGENAAESETLLTGMMDSFRMEGQGKEDSHEQNDT